MGLVGIEVIVTERLPRLSSVSNMSADAPGVLDRRDEKPPLLTSRLRGLYCPPAGPDWIGPYWWSRWMRSSCRAAR
jgi:hypothetical protein